MANIWSSQEPDDSDSVSEIIASEETSEDTGGDSLYSGASPSLQRGAMGLKRPPRFNTRAFTQVLEGLRRLTWCVYPGSLALCLRDAATLSKVDLEDRCSFHVQWLHH